MDGRRSAHDMPGQGTSAAAARQAMPAGQMGEDASGQAPPGGGMPGGGMSGTSLDGGLQGVLVEMRVAAGELDAHALLLATAFRWRAFSWTLAFARARRWLTLSCSFCCSQPVFDEVLLLRKSSYEKGIRCKP